jgi:hypothetical protein
MHRFVFGVSNIPLPFMKNKHILLLFVLAAASVWFWNYYRHGSTHQLTEADQSYSQFVEQIQSTESFVIDDGTEPNISLTHDEHGWRLHFGTLDTPADEDSVKQFLQDLRSASQVALPQTETHYTASLLTKKATWQLKKCTGSDALTIRNGSNKSALPDCALKSAAAPWLQKPYENWIFRKLQTLPAQQINDLAYEWADFGTMHLQQVDSIWQMPTTWLRPNNYLSDTLLTALADLNRLEPALQYDPMSESAQPFASLYINAGKGATLRCYRRTQQHAEYFLHSTHAPQIYFKLPTSLANQIFVLPMLR